MGALVYDGIPRSYLSQEAPWRSLIRGFPSWLAIRPAHRFPSLLNQYLFAWAQEAPR